MKTLLILICILGNVHAEVLKKEGKNFILVKSSFKESELLADYVRLEKLSVSINDGFNDETFVHQGKDVIPQDKIEKYVSAVLAQSNNFIIRMPGSRFINVVAGKDVRYSTLPVYKKPEDIPDNDNLIQFSYVLKHIEAHELARNMRPFIGRWGRVIDVDNSESIHIADNANNVKRQMQLIQFMDTEYFVKSKNEIDEINEKHKKILANEKSWIDIVIEHNGLFLIIFLAIGLIIGFGTRGYMMKRIEGGW